MKNEEYFAELKNLINNPEIWDENKFHVFDYEASSGKSQNALKYLANMATTSDKKAIYVQNFVRNNSLKDTVDTINSHAKQDVAFGFSSENSNEKKAIRQALNSKILCVSHQMYLKICYGNRSNLLDGRQVLIIDEFPKVVETEILSRKEIAEIWAYLPLNRKDLFQAIEKIMMMYRKFAEEMGGKNDKPFKVVDFKKYFITELDLAILKDYGQKNHSKTVEKAIKVLNNSPVFIGDQLAVLNNTLETLKKLKCNIILDANGFDKRYKLSDTFILRKQKKFYNYSSSKFLQYKINTSKEALRKDPKIYNKILSTLNLKNAEKTLFLTQKEDKGKIESLIREDLHQNGYSGERINQLMMDTFQVDYFGNIVGVNTYRNFKNTVILKTPIYNGFSYAMEYLFFKSNNSLQKDFNEEEYNEMRQSMIVGEMYQGLKRTNRDNSQQSTFYVFSEMNDVVDMVAIQFPGIKFERKEMPKSVTKRSRKKPTKSECDIQNVKEMLLEAKRKGEKKVAKKEISQALGLEKGNFSKLLKNLSTFLSENQMTLEYNWIVLDLK